MKNLLLFTLGPVQSFISQARKTHDLWAGSQLLSDLVRAATDVVGHDNVVFPSLRSGALPNRFVAWVPENEQNLQEFGKKVEDAVREEWRNIAMKTLQGIKIPKGFFEQIGSHLEIFWVIEENVKDYQTAVGTLEKNLAAIKNVRPFCQYNYFDKETGERGRKCSLDGRRNIKFFRSTSNHYAENGSVTIFGANGVSYGLLQSGEGLSAVSFVKRRYKYNETDEFKSTAEIALLDVLNFLTNDLHGIKALQDYRQGFHYQGKFNAQLYYEEGLSDRYLEKQGITVIGSINELSKQRKRAIEDYAKNIGGFSFQKYYAILTFDGDDMGKWLAGKAGFLKPETDLEDFHNKLAAQLGKFAGLTEDYLNDNRGQTAYAGGDDFLGFVNINYLFPALINLRRLFREVVYVPLSGFMEKEISFSAGICVAHYKEPLSLVLDNARNAQKAAKKIEYKNAFGIAVLKGSGESHLMTLPFGDGDNEINVEAVSGLVNNILHENFSNTFIKNLRVEFDHLTDENGWLNSNTGVKLDEVFKIELKRLILRACKNRDWNKQEKQINSKALADSLFGLYEATSDLRNFFQMLHIADFFQRTFDNKQLKLEPETV